MSYRFVIYIVEGDNSKMRAIAVDSGRTLNSARVKQRDYQRQNGISGKRIGIHDGRRKQWIDLPLILR